MNELSMRVLYTAEQIEEAVQSVATRIEAHWAGAQEVHVIALMNGALWFAADLMRALPAHYIIHTQRVSSYGEAHVSSGELTWHGELPKVQGKKVLIIDDVIDSGLTLKEMSRQLYQLGAAEVRSAVAISKSPQQAREIEADFVALEAGREFLIGYGMDEKGRYRNLPYIAVVEN